MSRGRWRVANREKGPEEIVSKEERNAAKRVNFWFLLTAVGPKGLIAPTWDAFGDVIG